MILVVGSTDVLGYEICYNLASQGKSIRALVPDSSDPVFVERLKNFGATLAVGDLHDPIFWADTYVGVNEVICSALDLPAGPPGETQPGQVDLAGFIALIDAAKAADVLRFVFITYSLSPDFSFPRVKGLQDIEQHLIDSGIPYTIFHTGEYTSQPGGRILIKDLARLVTEALEDSAQYNTVVEVDVPGTPALNDNRVLAVAAGKGFGRKSESDPLFNLDNAKQPGKFETHELNATNSNK